MVIDLNNEETNKPAYIFFSVVTESVRETSDIYVSLKENSQQVWIINISIFSAIAHS